MLVYKSYFFPSSSMLSSTLDNIKALDVLPYHDLAIPKYENLGKEYPLKGIPPLTKEQALDARNIILDAMRQSKLKNSNQQI